MLNVIAQLTGPGYLNDDPLANATGFSKFIFNAFSSYFDPAGTDQSLALLLQRIIPFAIVTAGLVFFGKLILSGFAFMTSAGDAAKVEKATKDLTNGAIGLVVVISAFFLIQIIQIVFGLKVI